jgi:hypothetical protein
MQDIMGGIMDVRSQTVGVRRAVVVAAFLGILVGAGCAPQARHRPARLLEESQLVGGGLMIHWQAPEDGTVYLVERRSGRLVETRALRAGEVYNFAIQTVVEAEDMRRLIGIPVARAEFLLYFEPAQRRVRAG